MPTENEGQEEVKNEGDAEPEKKKGGWPKGKPRGPRRTSPGDSQKYDSVKGEILGKGASEGSKFKPATEAEAKRYANRYRRVVLRYLEAQPVLTEDGKAKRDEMGVAIYTGRDADLASDADAAMIDIAPDLVGHIAKGGRFMWAGIILQAIVFIYYAVARRLSHAKERQALEAAAAKEQRELADAVPSIAKGRR